MGTCRFEEGSGISGALKQPLKAKMDPASDLWGAYVVFWLPRILSFSPRGHRFPLGEVFSHCTQEINQGALPPQIPSFETPHSWGIASWRCCRLCRQHIHTAAPLSFLEPTSFKPGPLASCLLGEHPSTVPS